jgi:hypothetical protein
MMEEDTQAKQLEHNKKLPADEKCTECSREIVSGKYNCVNCRQLLCMDCSDKKTRAPDAHTSTCCRQPLCRKCFDGNTFFTCSGCYRNACRQCIPVTCRVCKNQLCKFCDGKLYLRSFECLMMVPYDMCQRCRQASSNFLFCCALCGLVAAAVITLVLVHIALEYGYFMRAYVPQKVEQNSTVISFD